MCGCRHGTVRFLTSRKALQGVDWEFRPLVRFFNRIPYCATFGVSCAGNFHYLWYGTEDHPRKEQFSLSLYGELTIIVEPSKPHIQELMKLISDFIDSDPEANIQMIKHVFGPREGSLQTWEIRFSPMDEALGYQNNLVTADNPELWDKGRKHYRKSRKFWKSLGLLISDYCYRHHFRRFDLRARENEIFETWPIPASTA